LNQKVALMNLRKITPKLLCIFLSFLILNNSKAQNSIDDVGQINAINTAVPFLRIIPDARAGGMGDVGIASSADAGGTYFNNSKLVFAPKKLGINLSYTPWLRNLGITDIYLAHFSGYYQLDKNQVISTSLKFFSLGNITFTDFQGNITGDFRPREMALDVGYARKLGKYYSLGIQLRYIYSNLASRTNMDGVPIKAGNAFGSDITMSYFKPIKLKKMNSQLNVGLAITNLGSKISYSSDALNQDYIPTNAGLGLGYQIFPKEKHEMSVYVDINKLLVPTPDTVDADGDGIFDYKQKSSIAGVFSSLGDAPGGFKEEMREFNYSIGVEYWYDKQFAVRAGYFLENKLKGNRKFFTAGLSAKYSVFGLDFSYLVPTSNQRSPLDNTFRFTLSFNFDKLGKKDKSSESGSEVMPTPVEE
jgi:hypothetical protein